MGNLTNASTDIVSADRPAPSGVRHHFTCTHIHTHKHTHTHTYMVLVLDVSITLLKPRLLPIITQSNCFAVLWWCLACPTGIMSDELSPVIARNQGGYVPQVIGNKMGMSTIFSSQWRSLLYINSMRPSDIHMHQWTASGWCTFRLAVSSHRLNWYWIIFNLSFCNHSSGFYLSNADYGWLRRFSKIIFLLHYCDTLLYMHH